MFKDIRYGLRTLAKSPGFTFVAVLTLAVGIGANATMFSAVNATILRPMPVPEPDRVVRLYTLDLETENDFELSYPDYVDVRDRTTTLSGVAGHKLTTAALSNGDANELVWGELVTGNYFDVLGVAPVKGRGFLPEEDTTEGTHPVVVIGYDFWRTRFGDVDAVGKTLKFNGRDFTVVGIAPKEFTGTKFGLALDVWFPMMMHDQIRTMAAGGQTLQSRGSHWLEIIGRLAPGATTEQAAAELASIGADLAATYPDTNDQQSFTLFYEADVRFGEDARNGMRRIATLVLCLVGLVLLIACANVSNLLLARASSRQREIGVRAALGAGRARLVRQLMTESLLLAGLGGVGGVLLAYWASGLLLAFAPATPIPLALDLSPDTRVLGYSAAVTTLASMVFGLAPALQITRLDVVSVLKAESTGGGRSGVGRRLRDALVVVQLATSVVLLVGAGLCLRSLANAQATDPGFEARNLLFASVDLGLLNYSPERGRAFFDQLTERVRALPGVRSASVADILPLGDSHNSTGPFVPDGWDAADPKNRANVSVAVVSPNHFKTFGIEMQQGRDFDARDTQDATRVAVVNQTLAERYWPGENPIGKRFRIGTNPDARVREVIGVARTGKYRSLGEDPRPYLYLPMSQTYASQATLVVNTEGDPLALGAAVRTVVRDLDPNLPVYDVKNLNAHMTFALWAPRMGATLSSLFGSIALLLAVVGLYGVMSFVVSQQTREFGIRMALGAEPRDVLRMVVGRGSRLIGFGLGFGLVAALGVSRVLSGVLFGVGPVDPVVFVGILALLTIIALVAVYVPARRATQVDPIEALRYE